MSSIFRDMAASALDIGFELFGEPATYVSPAGIQSPCTPALVTPDLTADFGALSMTVHMREVRVRTEQVATVVKGGVFIINDKRWSVIEAQRRDTHRLVWTCVVQPA